MTCISNEFQKSYQAWNVDIGDFSLHTNSLVLGMPKYHESWKNDNHEIHHTYHLKRHLHVPHRNSKRHFTFFIFESWKTMHHRFFMCAIYSIALSSYPILIVILCIIWFHSRYLSLFKSLLDHQDAPKIGS